MTDTAPALRLGMVTIDTQDALALSSWWRDAFDGTILAENDGWFVMLALGEGQPVLGFQKVDDPTPGKNRIHLDLVADDKAGTVRALLASGARLVAEREMPGLSWVTLADPDGNEFCVASAADH
ncbi:MULTISPECIES: VOC family protein [unclassified Gordonia (in: high G+C Gram-positive bacteria)]|uniref:VOC family protein n=1 Tax=unclassified Gordonia (in: high G+C Gram-positive bacteria) TaxID=2657482 RepID=UPI0020002BDD|nr:MULTISPECIES: VOC family protein [unclassified Gordonia (in: high G+C Gram-positive bacteria)]UQE76677.1 VOC family protein [Gordonia sp. PP30]